MTRRDQADLCAAHAGGCTPAQSILRIFERGAGVRSMLRSMCAAWRRPVRLAVIVGLPVEPRAGPESFSEQSPDTRRESG